MKNLYRLQSILFILLIVIGRELHSEQRRLVAIFHEDGYSAGSYGDPSWYFGLLALCCCVVLLFVGFRTAAKMPKSGWFLFLVGSGAGFFAILMMISPRGISLAECLWAWLIVSVVVLAWSGIMLKRIAPTSPKVKPTYDDILDDI